jgi:methyl-accepting chemotaxis protein
LAFIRQIPLKMKKYFLSQKWGNFFSVFSPIKHNGETIGYLGIDISAEKTENTIADMLNLSYQILGPAVFGVFVLAFIILVVFVNRIKKQLTSIKESMHHVAAGDLRVRSERVTSDELGDISDYNNQMIQEIYFLLEKIQTSYGILRKASRNVAAVSEETVVQSDELSKAVNEIAAGATKQAMELDDSVGKSKQLEGMLEKISADIYEFNFPTKFISHF